MLKGDLTKFSPGDLLSFLIHLNQEGVLTVSQESQGLSISFKNGMLTAANSQQADAKVLASLQASGLIGAEQIAAIAQAHKETGLPLLQILVDTKTIDLTQISTCLELGIHEVFFQLFTWETGEFQFTEIQVEPAPGGKNFDCMGLTMDAARQVDEYREFLRNVPNEDSPLGLTAAGVKETDVSPELRIVLEGAAACQSIRQVMNDSPITSFATMKVLQEALSKGWIELRPNQEPVPVPVSGLPVEGRLFLSYKRALLKVMQAEDKRAKVAELLSYCKDQFDYFLLIAIKQNQVTRCRRFQTNSAGKSESVELKNPQGNLDADLTFGYVGHSGFPFFGKTFETPLLAEMGEPVSTGDCAIIPLGNKGDDNYLLYVRSHREETIPAPLQYLELISWHIHPPRKEDQPSRLSSDDPSVESLGPTLGGEVVKESRVAADDMVAAVNELPPMPHLVTKVIDLLSDPNSRTSELVEVLSRDPVLVSRLIRVSNSALYSRGHETTSLEQAVVRLGTKTIRSLVMAASMRSLFPVDKTNVGSWGQSLWQHSIECGLASRRVAKTVGYHDPEEAFVAGVLHDMGKVVILLHRPDDFRAVLKEQSATQDSFAATERKILGFDHTEVGELLLEKWRMPENLIACVKFHHQPSGAGEMALLVNIVAAGDVLSHRHGSQPDPDLAGKSNDFDQISRAIKLEENMIMVLQEEIGSDLQQSGFLD